MTRLPALGPRGEGWVALQGVLMVLILAATRVRMAPVTDAAFGEPLRAVGAVVVILSLGLIAWSSAELHSRSAFTAVPRPRIGGSLVETGPYRWIRHPIYAGLVLGGVGLAAWGASLASLLLTVALFVVLDFKRRREEAWLVAAYPDYEAYRGRTKALAPGIY